MEVPAGLCVFGGLATSAGTVAAFVGTALDVEGAADAGLSEDLAEAATPFVVFFDFPEDAIVVSLSMGHFIFFFFLCKSWQKLMLVRAKTTKTAKIQDKHLITNYVKYDIDCDPCDIFTCFTLDTTLKYWGEV